MSINWRQERNLYRDLESGDIVVAVEGGYMELNDYIEGGRVTPYVERALLYLGRMTNAEISNGEAHALA